MNNVRDLEKPSQQEATADKFRRLFPELVSEVQGDREFLDTCWDCVSVLNDAFRLPYSDIQASVLPALLHKEGLSAEDVKVATRIMLTSDTFAARAQYRAPLSAADFVSALKEKAPHRLIRN